MRLFSKMSDSAREINGITCGQIEEACRNESALLQLENEAREINELNNKLKELEQRRRQVPTNSCRRLVILLLDGLHKAY